MKLKDSSVNLDLDKEFSIQLGWAWREWELRYMGEFLITSAKDGHHREGSQHKQDAPNEPGEAVDVRTWAFWNPGEGYHDNRLIRYAKRLQDAGFRVVVHPDWIAGQPHLHIAKGKSLLG